LVLDMRHVHLIGIGGSGLSAIAKVMLERGYLVSGSDRQASPLLDALQQAGAQIYYGHRPENVAGADLVVRSSAVPDHNVEVLAARAAGIPVFKRIDFLEQLIADQQGIAVAGTHGKTTTTAMIAWILTALGLDPSYVIGGASANLGGNAHAGQGKHFVIEADEYDRMFLGLRPYMAVVTNVEHDHPDCYPTPQDFYQAFHDFASRLQPGGVLVACADDPGARRLLSEIAAEGQRVASYGLGQTRLDYFARDIHVGAAGGLTFEASCPLARGVVKVSLQVPGEHNVRNALAALAVADLLGLSLDAAAQALGEFRGTSRRFEVRGEAAGIVFIDDYAHHPTEIRSTLSAARLRFHGRRLWAVWQPHTYSRTRTFFEDFLKAFDEADEVLVTEIYAARETPPADGFSARQIVEAMAVLNENKAARVSFVSTLTEATDFLLERLKPGDVVVVLSAGDADQINASLLKALQAGKFDQLGAAGNLV
jgi:UDP-N-acetylmuramate--alanine ligase